MSKAILETLQQAFDERRSIYALGNNLPSPASGGQYG